MSIFWLRLCGSEVVGAQRRGFPNARLWSGEKIIGKGPSKNGNEEVLICVHACAKIHKNLEF